MDRNSFQAASPTQWAGTVAIDGYYPTIPAYWPNRQVRRAVKQGRDHRLPSEWRAALAVNPPLRAAIRVL